MIEKSITIALPNGLHARPATLFVQKATSFSSDIKLVTNKKEANGKSIMGLLAAGIKKGEEVKLIVNGSDEKQAVTALEEILTTEVE
ncbi:MAG TPA: HPr family phosphocarrier protein [Bacillota bacterium]|nr:HPr family phosphocarrier protein [Bacillota bacterium]